MALNNEQIKEQLRLIREGQPGLWNIAPEEGQSLYDLVKTTGARRVVEIGTSNGYSGSWFAMGLRETGGTLITFEADLSRFELAERNFQELGLSAHIDSRLVDAKQELASLEGPFDIVFIDAWKPDYINYYELALPKVRPGGLILAHNVVSHAAELEEFVRRIESDPAVTTEIVTLGPQGLSVSTKKP